MSLLFTLQLFPGICAAAFATAKTIYSPDFPMCLNALTHDVLTYPVQLSKNRAES